MSACFCIGPQDGAKLCPCMERQAARRGDGLRARILRNLERQRSAPKRITAAPPSNSELIGEGCYHTLRQIIP